MMRALNHASYVFEKRLSHTADSQDQRHRMVPASRPMMTFADTHGARLRHAAADPPEPRGAGGLRAGDGRRVDGQEPAARARRAARVRALRRCPTPRRCGWSSRDRSSRCSTSGRCAPASTRRKRSTWRRWTRSARCRRCTRSSGATSARRACCATRSCRRAAPKARTSAACRSGTRFPNAERRL